MSAFRQDRICDPGYAFPQKRPQTLRAPFSDLTEETAMKRSALFLPLSAAVALVHLTALAGNVPETAVMLAPDQLQWVDNPRVSGLGLAKMVGDGKEPGPYVYRVKFPQGRVVQAHSHPDDRTYTVLSGTWYIGWGETYDPERLMPMPAGSFYTEPAGLPHFVATPDGETIVQVSGTGPTTVDYVDTAHPPKK